MTRTFTLTKLLFKLPNKKQSTRTVSRPSGWTDSFEDYQKWSVYVRLKR